MVIETGSTCKNQHWFTQTHKHVPHVRDPATVSGSGEVIAYYKSVSEEPVIC